MRLLLRQTIGRTLSILVALSLFVGTASAGMGAMAHDLGKAIKQALQPAIPSGYTEAPGPVFLGDKPSRDAKYRAGIWNDTSLSDLQWAALQWGATPSQVGGQASLHPAARPQITPDGGGGINYPWEAPVPAWQDGTLNTNTGNLLTHVPILSWPAIAGSGVSLTLFHNSQSSFEDGLGFGWSNNYDCRIMAGPGGTTVVRWGDGTTIPYTLSEFTGLYAPPTGIHDALVALSGGGWKVTKPDNAVYTFSSNGRLTSIADHNGNGVTIAQGTNGISTVTDGCGRVLTFNYDYMGWLISVSDPTGRTWLFNTPDHTHLSGIQFPALGGHTYSDSFTYDSGNRIATMATLSGGYESLTYLTIPGTTTIAVATATTALSHTTTYTYTASSCTVTLPGGQHSTYNYSGGRLASFVDAAGFSVGIGYDGSNNVSQITDKRGKIWHLTWNSKGSPLTVQDPLGDTATMTYWPGNQLKTFKDGANNLTQYNYDTAGNLLTVIDPLGKTVLTNTYTTLGQLLTTKDALGHQFTLGYGDSYGDVTQVTDPLGHSVSATFDILGNPLTSTDAVGNTETYGLDGWGRVCSVTHPGGATASAVIDACGRVSSVTDELSHSAALYYDGEDHIKSAVDALGNTQYYFYDTNGWLASSENARTNSRTYNHTATGRLESVTLPDGEPMTFAYNANGQLSQYINPAGDTINYAFDDAGRRTTVDYPTGTDTSFVYDAADRVHQMVDSMGTSTITYNADSEVTQLASPQGTVNYTYFDNGLTHTMQRAGDALAQTFSYDNANRLTTILNQFSQSSSFQYDNADRLSIETLGNGTWNSYGYDSRSRLNSLINHKPDNSTSRTETYGFDDASNILTKTVDGVQTTYGYDGDGQLLSESSPGYSASYSYDPNGNRLARTVNGVAETYSYDSADKLQSVTSSGGNKTYTYDNAGRTKTIVTSAGTTTFTYDFDGHATSITLPNATTNSSYFNGLGTRVKRVDTAAGTRTFLHDGLAPADNVVYDGSVSFTPGVSERTSAAQDRWYNDDGLGSLTDMTDASGNILAGRTFDAYGNQKTGTTFGYLHGYGEAGNYQEDHDSGLKLCGLRYYDPSIGRFLTPDPAAVGPNWYAYCGNNPVTRFDPTGLQAEDIEDDWFEGPDVQSAQREPLDDGTYAKADAELAIPDFTKPIEESIEGFFEHKAVGNNDEITGEYNGRNASSTDPESLLGAVELDKIIGDQTFDTKEEAFAEAVWRHGFHEDYEAEAEEVREKPSTTGPRGEPYVHIYVTDGKNEGTVMWHLWGHNYPDGGYVPPHFNGPGGRTFFMVHESHDSPANPTCEWSFGPIAARLERHLPGFRDIGARALWLRPNAGRFTASVIDGIAEALLPHRLIAWFPPIPRNTDPEADGFSGSFSVEIGNLGINYRSFVKWVSQGDHLRVAELLQDFEAGASGRFGVAVAALPYDSIVAARFCKAVQGPAWLWLRPDWIANHVVRSFHPASVVANYASIVFDLRGLVFLTWIDEWDRTGVAVLGMEPQIEGLAAGLANRTGFLERSDLLADSPKVGVNFKMCVGNGNAELQVD